ncbi:MAG: 4'-phosphopantetheinyl transferase superfamily protein [Myxococcota bacterium]|nr:4'-phosphopantetheinyl transferase superfamily protein [Myxococcota bacterium]
MTDGPSAEIEALFPEGVVVVVASGALWDAPLLPEEERCVAGAAERRRRQFAAGRACAREALARLGAPPAPLLRQADRSPRWPEGVVGSISHCDGRCAAAVAWEADFAGLGLDVERRGRATDRLLPRVATPRERARLEAAEAGNELLTLLFSAKESVYKCLSRHLLGTLRWHDVEVEFGPGARIAVQLLRAPAALGGLPARLEGGFSLGAETLATAVFLPARAVGHAAVETASG